MSVTFHVMDDFFQTSVLFHMKYQQLTQFILDPVYPKGSSIITPLRLSISSPLVRGLSLNISETVHHFFSNFGP